MPELFAHKDATHRSGRRPAAVTRSLPDHPRARAERVHAALPETGAAENLDLTEVLSEIRGWTMRRGLAGSIMSRGGPRTKSPPP